MPAGRPTKYKPEYCEMLIEHMAEGLSYEAFAGIVSVSYQTIYDWEIHKEFLEAKEIGFSKCLLFWEKLMRLSAAGKIKPPPAILIYNMRARFAKQGWNVSNNDRHQLEAAKPIRTAYARPTVDDENTIDTSAKVNDSSE